MYPFYARVATPGKFYGRAIVRLCADLGWSRVAVLTTDIGFNIADADYMQLIVNK